VKNENKVFCLKIDDFLNVFGFFMGLCRGLIDDNPKHIKYVDDPLIKLKLIGQKNMRITDIKNLLNKEIDDSIVISRN
jgi:hypothetical protein